MSARMVRKINANLPALAVPARWSPWAILQKSSVVVYYALALHQVVAPALFSRNYIEAEVFREKLVCAAKVYLQGKRAGEESPNTPSPATGGRGAREGVTPICQCEAVTAEYRRLDADSR